MNFRSQELAQVSNSDMKVFNKFGEEVSPLFLRENIESFYSQLRIFGMHASIGSLYAFSASISGHLSNQVVTLKGEDYTVVFVSPFRSVLLDEFAHLENSRTKARFENHEVVFLRDSLDSLLSLGQRNIGMVVVLLAVEVISDSSNAVPNSPPHTAVVAVPDSAVLPPISPQPGREASSSQCNGKTNQRTGCQNRTCCMYSIDGVEFKPALLLEAQATNFAIS